MIITATFYGTQVTYPRYNIPAIEYKDGLLFTTHDKNYLKFILTDKSYNVVSMKYSDKKIDIQNSDQIKSEFEHSKHIIDKDKDYYALRNFQTFDTFPPENCLQK